MENKKEFKIHEQDKFLAKNKKKFEKNNKDIKAKEQSLDGILNSLNDIPTKISVGSFSSQSVLPTKKDENSLHGGDGSAIQKKRK